MNNATRGTINPSLTDAVRARAQALTKDPASYNPLLRRIGDAHLALLGEASHGTYEFYRERAEITKRLITERGPAAGQAARPWRNQVRAPRGEAAWRLRVDPQRTPKRWLLIKRRDEHVDESWDVESPELDCSVLSGRTLHEIAQGRPSRHGKR